MVKWQSEQGFTLAQMAVVILLSGILMTMGITTMQALNENSALAVTNKRLEQIEKALKIYLLRSTLKRLPCPDKILPAGPGTAFDGSADRHGGDGAMADSCVADSGLLPYVTLGLQRRGVVDGWGNYFTYHLDGSGNFAWGAANGNSPNLANVGSLRVIRRNQNGQESGSVSDAVVVVVSHGSNGLGSYTIKGTQTAVLPGATLDENENSDADALFVERDHSDRADYKDSTGTVRGGFDDILLVLGVNSLFDGGGLASTRSDNDALFATAQQDLQLLNSAARRFNSYMMTYVDNYPLPKTTAKNTDDAAETADKPGDNWDSNPDENGLNGTGDKENIFTDPTNIAYPNIDPMLGFNFLSANSQGGKGGESALQILRGDSTGLPFVAVGLQRDPWGEEYLWDLEKKQFFSKGSDKSCLGGDDVTATATGLSRGGGRCAKTN